MLACDFFLTDAQRQRELFFAFCAPARLSGVLNRKRLACASAPVGANISRDESSLQIDLSDLNSTVTASP